MRRLHCLVIFLFTISISYAVELDITTLQNATNAQIKTVIQTFAIGGDYKAVHYATPEGFPFGTDVGIEVTAVKVSDDFKAALTTFGNLSDDVPDMIPLPRLNITKGLPFGIDAGFSFLKIKIQGVEVLNYGGSLKYAILPGEGLIPAVAVRGTFNKGEYLNKRVKTTTYGAEALASMSFFMVEPFGGIGYQKGKGEVDASGIPGADRVDLDLDHSISGTRFFVGATFKFWIVHLAAQADFGKENTYSAKVSINF